MTKTTFTVDYYDYEGQERGAGVEISGSTDLRLHLKYLPALEPWEFHLPEDAIVGNYRVVWSDDPERMEQIFLDYWDMKAAYLWINEHGPFPYSMGSVRFDASGVPIDHCPHCQEEYGKALGEPEWEVFV